MRKIRSPSKSTQLATLLLVMPMYVCPTQLQVHSQVNYDSTVQMQKMQVFERAFHSVKGYPMPRRASKIEMCSRQEVLKEVVLSFPRRSCLHAECVMKISFELVVTAKATKCSAKGVWKIRTEIPRGHSVALDLDSPSPLKTR